MIRVSRHNLVLPPDLGLQTHRFLDVACGDLELDLGDDVKDEDDNDDQGCISCGMCSYPELTKDHVLTSAYVRNFRTVTRNAVNKSV